MMKGSRKMVCLFALYVFLAASGLILFKLGSQHTTIQMTLFHYSISFSFQMLFGMFCYGCSFLLWMYIVSQMDLTIAMPLSVAFVNLFVVLGSCVFLKEKIALGQGIGIFLIILGVAVMTGKQ